jgi:signal transduction histidine kinase
LPAVTGLAARLPSATGAGVAIGFALLLLPANARDPQELGLAAATGLALILIARSGRATANAQLVVAVGYLLCAALLRDGAGGGASGFSGLFLLPVIWLALTAGKRELLLGLLAMLFALAVPLVAIGAPAYPSSGFRGSVVLLSVGVAVGFSIQQLLGQTRQAVLQAHARAEELEQATTLLAEQNERLLELDRVKNEFIGVVSHELRTPLTSIIGFMELVLEDAAMLSADHQKFLGTVSRNVDRLSLLVNDLLFLASTDAGELTLNMRSVDLAELLEQAEHAARPRAESKQITLALKRVPLPTIEGDDARLAQLLDNLISNAIKFTPNGGQVTLRAGTANGHVAIEVEDSGIGIPAAEIPLLFSRFYRASSATENQIEGTGLGLAISQTIANGHNGRIEVTSEPGHGTTFRLLLPAHEPAQSAKRVTTPGADSRRADQLTLTH